MIACIMARSSDFKCCPTDLQRLEAAVRNPPEFLTAKKLRHLRILYSLCKGETGRTIATREGVTPARVSSIRCEAIRETPCRIIERLLLKSNPAVKRRTHAGRPGIEAPSELLRTMSPKKEPVFELSSLFLTADVKIGVISFRDNAQRDSGEDGTETMRRLGRIGNVVGEIRESSGSGAVFWTKVSMHDTLLGEVFQRVRQRADQLPSIDFATIELSPLGQRFNRGFHHILLWEGQRSACERVIDYLSESGDVTPLRADEQSGLMGHLERVLYQRRNRRSCAGFMPQVHLLWEYVKTWSVDRANDVFHWEINQQQTEQALKLQSMTQDYFAAVGVLPCLRPFLWSSVPHKDEIAFRTLPVSTRIQILERIDDGHVRLRISPLPGVAYNTVVPWSGPPEELAQRCRKAVRVCKDAQRIIYSTRPSEIGGARDSLLVPREFFKTGKEESLRGGTGVVLLPRHFLTPEPLVQVASLPTLQQNKEPGYFESVLPESALKDATEEVIYGINVNELLDSVRQRMLEGYYFWRFEEIEDWESGLTELDTEISFKWGCYCRLRANATLGPDIWELLNFNGSEPQHPEQSPLIQREEDYLLLEERAIKRKAYDNILRQELDNLLASFKNGSHSICQEAGNRFLRMLYMSPRPAPGVIKAVERILPTFLVEVDADFLLRSLHPMTRVKLERTTKVWSKKCREMIREEFWPNGRFDATKARKLVRASLQGYVEPELDEVQSIFSDLLIRERLDAKFVVRSAIENLQRCILTGIAPIAIHVEGKQSILRRWNAYISKAVNGRLYELAKTRQRNRDYNLEIMADDAAIFSAATENDACLEIAEVVDRLSSGNFTDDVLMRFIGLCKDTDRSSWSNVISDLRDSASGEQFVRKILDGIRLCRQPVCEEQKEASAQSLLEKLMGIFGANSASSQATTKGRTHNSP